MIEVHYVREDDELTDQHIRWIERGDWIFVRTPRRLAPVDRIAWAAIAAVAGALLWLR